MRADERDAVEIRVKKLVATNKKPEMMPDGEYMQKIYELALAQVRAEKRDKE